MSSSAGPAPSSAVPPCSPFRGTAASDQGVGVSVGRIASLPIRPPSNSIGLPNQMTPREYGSSRPDSWHPVQMGSYGMRNSGYPMSEGIPRWDGPPPEYESAEPYTQGLTYNRPDPRGWQPPYEPTELPTVLTLRLCEIVNLLPVTEHLFDPRGIEYEIIPVVQSPGQHIVDSQGEKLGPFMAERSDQLWRVTINSPVLRFAYNPNKLYHFKILECDGSTRHVMGVATLSLTPDGPDIAISQNPLVPPEQIINHPQFKRSFSIQARDAMPRGELIMSMLFDYARPGEVLWPSDQYLAKMEGDLRAPSDTRSTSAEMGGTTETQRSVEYNLPRRMNGGWPVPQAYPQRQRAAVAPYMPIHDMEDDDQFSGPSLSWWDIIGPELQNNLKFIFCLDTKEPTC